LERDVEHEVTPEGGGKAAHRHRRTAYPLTSAICFTYGGIRTDLDARVVTANGVPLPGLYAAGEIVGLFYHEYPAGTSVLRSLTFGRIAGIHAAKSSFANR
jgi:tricarballylate dehydrogenase